MINYLTIDELSEYIHLSSSSIYKKTSQRQIPFIKTGKKLLFKRDAIDDWLAGHYCPTQEEIANKTVNFLKPIKNGN
jgi:excisionase family DNA binding protein